MLSLYYDLELKLVPVLYEMEVAGIKVDGETIKVLSQRYKEEEQELSAIESNKGQICATFKRASFNFF